MATDRGLILSGHVNVREDNTHGQEAGHSSVDTSNLTISQEPYQKEETHGYTQPSNPAMSSGSPSSSKAAGTLASNEAGQEKDFSDMASVK